jgi:hypothetical protein
VFRPGLLTLLGEAVNKVENKGCVNELAFLISQLALNVECPEEASDDIVNFALRVIRTPWQVSWSQFAHQSLLFQPVRLIFHTVLQGVPQGDALENTAVKPGFEMVKC